ncbi:MAG TPA: Kdo hydroxylase family protein [Acetobacteraceae bacterium]|nr:Kdo hydroxylase family protein [Acetobacteraceae bacterium]
MREEGVLAVLDIAAWGGPIDPAEGRRATHALEEGRVLFLPALRFAVEESEKKFLSAAALAPGRKNISLDPASGACQGSHYAGEEAQQLGAMLDRFARQAEALMRAIAPGYANALRRARTSFRPADIEDRASSVRKDDRLLHVDAFPTRPTRGERILRVFSNIAPDGAERRWEVGEPFPDFAEKFLPRVTTGWAGSAWLIERLGLTKGRRSAYDTIMLGLHDAMKRDARYQAEAPHAALSFPPGTSWIVYTDQVLHAALAGRFALEQTFHLPVAAMAEPELAPLRVLERLKGRALA